MSIEAARKARFRTADDVKEAVLTVSIRIALWRVKAEQCEKKADGIRDRWMHRDESEQRRKMFVRCGNLRDRAIRLRKRAIAVEGGYMTRLKSKLAIIQTQLLPGMGEDQSIPK